MSKAFEELDSGQLNDLSLRAIARDLNVSHQASYQHFKSKDSLIRTMSVECFKQFSEALNNRAEGADEWDNLRSMGIAYVRFALNFPHRYKLTLIKKSDLSGGQLDPQADALYIWSCLHGLVSLLENPLTDRLPVRESTLKNLVEHVLIRIGTGIRNVP